jgi:hypothetical protein
MDIKMKVHPINKRDGPRCLPFTIKVQAPIQGLSCPRDPRMEAKKHNPGRRLGAVVSA